MRTSKLIISIRATVIAFVIYLGMSWAWNSITGKDYWTTSEMAISAVLTVLIYGGFAWLVTTFGMFLLYGRDPEYRRWKQQGGDPYFDSLPSPLNPDSKVTRKTGIAEPTTSLVPPQSWTFQCPVCGSKQPSKVCVCWNCHYGADNDSTAYFEKFGTEKLPKMS